MFGKHPDRMLPESTPERVYALCKWALCCPATREDLRARLVMKDVFGDQADIFSKTIKCSEELGLIADRDGVVNVAVPESILHDFAGFRNYISKIVFNKKDTTFFKISEWYLAQNEKVYTNTNWESVAAKADSEGISVREEDMLGWRWWASFLGLGYLHGTSLISNLTVRLKDCLTNAEQCLPKGEQIPAALFVKSLENMCPETIKSRNERVLGLGISNGLRVLVNSGTMSFAAQPDADRWNFYPIDGIAINDFSHVMVKE